MKSFSLALLSAICAFSCSRGEPVLNPSSSVYPEDEAARLEREWLEGSEEGIVNSLTQFGYGTLNLALEGESADSPPSLLRISNIGKQDFPEVVVRLNGAFIYRIEVVEGQHSVVVPLHRFLDWQGNRFDYEKTAISNYRIFPDGTDGLIFQEGTFVTKQFYPLRNTPN